MIQGYSPQVDYDALDYGVTAIIQLNIEGSGLSEVADSLREYEQLISVYEVTGDHDVVAIGKFRDTEDMNGLIKKLINNTDINESDTSVVLNTVSENKQFELET